ncbi:hypothetical protein GDO81_021900 [Engystomops pustulosus]|uniref:Uncharacterized protein n=1 Tax=Engystomops pustulosus TaxID=76066 RepID=A0AAV6ZU62_ENGPU|nr:hypothetical protein GDO81_021900 [Engystomops pustulosus]
MSLHLWYCITALAGYTTSAHISVHFAVFKAIAHISAMYVGHISVMYVVCEVTRSRYMANYLPTYSEEKEHEETWTPIRGPH